jgi:hypothetical protein
MVVAAAVLVATVTIMGMAGRMATQTVRGHHIYRFQVPAGKYRIWSNASTTVNVVVDGGHVVDLDLPDLCR